MNWVGGVRDRIRRCNKAHLKQKEYFERKRLANCKQQKTKYAKKGLSRDILNLNCVSKTIRNPFDENISKENAPLSKTFPKKLKSVRQESNLCQKRHITLPDSYENSRFPSQIEFAEATDNEDIFVRNRQQSNRNICNPQVNLPSYHSTPIATKNYSITNKFEERPTLESAGPLINDEFQQLSPIYSQNSFYSSTFHPVSMQTDEELLLQETCPSSHLYSPEHQSFSSLHLDLTLCANKETTMEHLHGIPSSEKCSASYETATEVPVNSHRYDQYDLLRSFLPNAETNNQTAFLHCHQPNNEADNFLPVNKHDVDLAPSCGEELVGCCDVDCAPPASLDDMKFKGRCFDNEDIFTFTDDRNSTIRNNYEELSATLPSSARKENVLSTSQIVYAENQSKVASTSTNRYIDVAQQTDLFEQPNTCDACTSPIRWPRVENS